MSDLDEYWSIDVTGLDEQGAAQLLETVSSLGLGAFQSGSAIDPRIWYNRHFDRDTVKMLVIALQTSTDVGKEDRANLLEDMVEWLSSTRDDS
jgi:hypothetical protein